MMAREWYFYEDYGYPVCVICGDIDERNLSYCGVCNEYFCPSCAKNWAARARATKDKALKHLVERFA